MTGENTQARGREDVVRWGGAGWAVKDTRCYTCARARGDTEEETKYWEGMNVRKT